MISIINILICIFLIWSAYDTIKKEGLRNGLLSIIIIFVIILVVVLVPHFWGKTGKYLMYSISGIVLIAMVTKSILAK